MSLTKRPRKSYGSGSSYASSSSSSYTEPMLTMYYALRYTAGMSHEAATSFIARRGRDVHRVARDAPRDADVAQRVVTPSSSSSITESRRSRRRKLRRLVFIARHHAWIQRFRLSRRNLMDIPHEVWTAVEMTKNPFFLLDFDVTFDACRAMIVGVSPTTLRWGIAKLYIGPGRVDRATLERAFAQRGVAWSEDFCRPNDELFAWTSSSSSSSITRARDAGAKPFVCVRNDDDGGGDLLVDDECDDEEDDDDDDEMTWGEWSAFRGLSTEFTYDAERRVVQEARGVRNVLDGVRRLSRLLDG